MFIQIVLDQAVSQTPPGADFRSNIVSRHCKVLLFLAGCVCVCVFARECAVYVFQSCCVPGRCAMAHAATHRRLVHRQTPEERFAMEWAFARALCPSDERAESLRVALLELLQLPLVNACDILARYALVRDVRPWWYLGFWVRAEAQTWHRRGGAVMLGLAAPSVPVVRRAPAAAAAQQGPDLLGNAIVPIRTGSRKRNRFQEPTTSSLELSSAQDDELPGLKQRRGAITEDSSSGLDEYRPFS